MPLTPLVFAVSNILYWLCYLLGQVALTYIRADASAASDVSAWNSVRDYLRHHQRDIIRTFILATVLYIGWWRDPALLAKLISYTGVTFDPSAVPVTKFSSFIFGGASQFAVEYLWQRIKTKFSSSNDPQPPQQGQAVGGGS